MQLSSREKEGLELPSFASSSKGTVLAFGRDSHDSLIVGWVGLGTIGERAQVGCSMASIVGADGCLNPALPLKENLGASGGLSSAASRFESLSKVFGEMDNQGEIAEVR